MTKKEKNIDYVFKIIEFSNIITYLALCLTDGLMMRVVFTKRLLLILLFNLLLLFNELIAVNYN